MFAKCPAPVFRNCGLRLVSTVGVNVSGTQGFLEENDVGSDVLPYESIPGPKPLPILGNNWRFIPYIGQIMNICIRVPENY